VAWGLPRQIVLERTEMCAHFGHFAVSSSLRPTTADRRLGLMMATTLVKGIAFDAEVAPLLPHMSVVNDHREALQRLQDVWDQLTLLGQMSGIAADMSATASEFHTLTQSLLNSLAQRLLSNARHELAAQAQTAIDILVRNLFERTADIVFMATDPVVREFLAVETAPTESARTVLEARLQAYVAKYSVYDDVIVLSPSGDVLARLNHAHTTTHCAHPLMQQCSRAGVPYAESFGEVDLLDGRRGLIYSAAIRGTATSQLLGVLCLSYRFDDEINAIFAQLAHSGEGGTVTLADQTGTVLASSDVWHLPIGAKLRGADNRGRMYFAGREYLAVACKARPYEGYAGPPWTACAMMPVERAFAPRIAAGGAEGHTSAVGLPRGAMDSSPLFGEELRRIPRQALDIQQGLERSVWNGQVSGCKRVDAGSSGRFAAVLLQQVTLTGERIRGVFERAIGELQHSAADSVLEEARLSAARGIDILDRNQFERANDCRWWALDARLQRALLEPTAKAEAASVLKHINRLFTVYSRLLLLDANARIVASSTEARNDASQGAVACAYDWVRPALALRDDQGYVRSKFEPSALYDARHTYIFAAAVQPPNFRGAPIGAVAIVFDGQAQFLAMLQDVLPRGAQGEVLPQASGLFVTRDGQVVASTDARFAPGSSVNVYSDLASLARGESRCLMLEIDGDLCAAGVAMSRGYREYNSSTLESRDDIACLVIIRLCQRSAILAPPERVQSPAVLAVGADPACDLASFRCCKQWFALRAHEVLEAVDCSTLTRLPGSPASLAGLMKYLNEPMPVLELRFSRLMNEADAAASDRRPIIVCQIDGRRFGLRVDELGSVLHVAHSALEPLPDSMVGHDPLAEALIHTRESADMIVLLSGRQVFARMIRAKPADIASATPA
jgi:chemotaxis signal transduction protein